MIAFLKGLLAYKTPHSIVIDVHGVGYEVRMSERHLNTMPLIPGEKIEITTHFIPREDSFELYGFISPQEKELFLQLTKVSGVGPRTALAIFSCLDLNEIIRAIVGNQPKVLSQAPGVGAKTAQRVILDLREKLEKMQSELMPIAALKLDLPADWLEEIELTLIALGYEAAEIQRALQEHTQQLKKENNLDDALRVLLTLVALPL